MKHQLEAAYIAIESPDPKRVATYLRDVVGLLPGEPTASGALTFRADGKAQRVIIHQGPRSDASCIGFEAVDRAAFDACVSQMRAKGYEVTPGTAEEKAERRVQDLVSLQAPWGVRAELALGLADAATPFHSDAFPNGIVTQGQGFGHFVFKIGGEEAYEEARRFSMEALGLRLTDTLRMPMDGWDMRVTFLHCNGRHHSLALAQVPPPAATQVLHHINFEVSGVRDVGTAYERALRTGTPIANTIGQHANDRMISFYSFGPDGWQVEVGATGRTVDASWSDFTEYDRISDWGHQPPEVLAQIQAAATASR